MDYAWDGSGSRSATPGCAVVAPETPGESEAATEIASVVEPEAPRIVETAHSEPEAPDAGTAGTAAIEVESATRYRTAQRIGNPAGRGREPATRAPGKACRACRGIAEGTQGLRGSGLTNDLRAYKELAKLSREVSQAVGRSDVAKSAGYSQPSSRSHPGNLKKKPPRHSSTISGLALEIQKRRTSSRF